MDWMYKGLEGMVDEESYLLGRSVDKTFDQIKNEKEKKSSDFEAVLAKRTLPEDPLLAIKKKEVETRQQLLKNPVKLKKMQEMVCILKQRWAKHNIQCHIHFGIFW